VDKQTVSSGVSLEGLLRQNQISSYLKVLETENRGSPLSMHTGTYLKYDKAYKTDKDLQLKLVILTVLFPYELLNVKKKEGHPKITALDK